MATTVEIRDPYTAGHQRRVADLARAIATEMALSKDQVQKSSKFPSMLERYLSLLSF